MGFDNLEKYNDPSAAAKLEAIKAIQAKELADAQAEKLGKLKKAEEDGELVMPNNIH